jgi:hypothetical protein
MGRKRRWPERTAIKFAEGTFEKIAILLEEDEDRMAFMREAVDREIMRRAERVALKRDRQIAREGEQLIEKRERERERAAKVKRHKPERKTRRS